MIEDKLYPVTKECQDILQKYGINELLANPIYGRLGSFVEISVNGIKAKRKVYDDHLAGLYIVVKNVKVFADDVDCW